MLYVSLSGKEILHILGHLLIDIATTIESVSKWNVLSTKNGNILI